MNFKSKKMLFFICLITGLALTIVGSSYAFINIYADGDKISGLTTPEITLSYDETGTALSIDKKIETDDAGKILPYYSFVVSGSSTVEYPCDYTIYLTEDASNNLTKDKVKFYLTKMSGTSESVILSPTLGNKLLQYENNVRNLILYKTTYNFSGTNSFSDEYRLRAWVDANNDFEIEPDITEDGTNKDILVNSLTYKFKLNVATKRHES